MSVIYDTFPFLRALGENLPEQQALIHSNQKRHMIYYSNPILKEYLSKAQSHGMSGIIFKRKLDDFFMKYKTKRIGKVSLVQAQSIIKNKHCKLCVDVDDHKFIEAALAGKVRFVITSDHGLLGLCPYTCNGITIEFVDSISYTQIR